MSQANKGNSVQKEMGPEEIAMLQNVAAGIQELLSMANPGSTPTQEPDLTAGCGAPVIQKASEQGTTPAQPQAAMQPDASPKDQGMAPWDDKATKAFAKALKALVTSDTDGTTANDNAQQRLEDTTDEDKKNIAEVAKALKGLLSGGSNGVAKAMGSVQNPADPMVQLMTVVKSLSEQVAQQGAFIGEILQGIGIANDVQAPTQVQKSQENRPYAGADGVDLAQIVTAVMKGMQQANPVHQIEAGDPPVAKGFETAPRGSAIREFSKGFVDMSRETWGASIPEDSAQ